MFKNLTRNALALAAGAAFCAPSAHAFVVNDTFAGNWGDVDGGSRGLIIDILENRDPAGDFAPAVLVEWFTYDEDGNPLWLISARPRSTVTPTPPPSISWSSPAARSQPRTWVPRPAAPGVPAR